MKRTSKRTEEMFSFVWSLQTLQMDKLILGSWLDFDFPWGHERIREKDQGSVEDLSQELKEGL